MRESADFMSIKNMAAKTLLFVAFGACVITAWAVAEKAIWDAEEAIREERVSAAASASAEREFVIPAAAPSLYGVEREDAADSVSAAPYTFEELDELACAIYCEAGSDSISDLTRYYVGDVILNRVESDEFPSTIHGVLTQDYAYGCFAWTGVVWPEYSRSEWEAAAVERAYDVARDLLEGNHTWMYGLGYVWQSEYRQSEESFWLDGFWFGR